MIGHPGRATALPNILETRFLQLHERNTAAPSDCSALQRCHPYRTAVRWHSPAIGERGAPQCNRRLAVKSAFLAVLLGLASSLVVAQQPDKSAASDHEAHAKMNERGDKGMGFSQAASTHHFLLKPDGGVIQAEANDPNDTASRASIRMHMRHIARAFSSGDFDIPMFVHDTTPPGVPEMKRLAGKIVYRFEETPAGARVVIATADPEGRAAVYKFLRFQIKEHQTHDPTEAP